MAGQEDGLPYAERSQTPDQQAAGLPAISAPSAGLLDMLNGPSGYAGAMAGAGPSGLPALLGMMQPPSQAATFAAALSGGISAARGQADPVQQIQQNTQKQQNVLGNMLAKLQEHQDLNRYRQSLISDRDREFRLRTEQFQAARDQEALKKNEAALTTMRSVLDNPNTTPSAITLIGPQYAQKMKETFGVDIPPSIVQRTMSEKEQDQVLLDLRSGLPPELILKNHPAMSPQDLQAYGAIKDNRTVLERLKLKSPEDQQEQALRIKGLSADLIEKEHPELRLDPKTGAAALMKAKILFPGQDYHTLDTEQRAMVYKLAVLEQRQQVIDEYAMKEKIQVQARLSTLPTELKMRSDAALAARGQAGVADKPGVAYVDTKGNLAPLDLTIDEAKARGYNAIAQKELDTLNTGHQAMLILRNLKATVDEMKTEKLFVTKSGLPGMIQEGTIAAQAKWGDPEVSKRLLGNFETQKGHVIILMRLLGEKGVRFQASMLPAMEALSPAKGAPSVEQFLGQVESEIRILTQNTKTPDAFDSMPTVFPRRTSKDIPSAGPLAPPKGWAIEEVRP